MFHFLRTAQVYAVVLVARLVSTPFYSQRCPGLYVMLFVILPMLEAKNRGEKETELIIT